MEKKKKKIGLEKLPRWGSRQVYLTTKVFCDKHILAHIHGK